MEKSLPMISVIVPVYNTEKYLEECIESILNQTFKDYEIILVDDGSTDGSGEICDRYAHRYDFITVIHTDNNGITKARKTGLKISHGRYISFIDSDDMIQNEMYEYMSDKINRYNVDMVMCNLTMRTKSDDINCSVSVENGFYNKDLLKQRVYPIMMYDFNLKSPGIKPSLGDKLIRRDIIEKNLVNTDNDLIFGEDAICTYSCLLDAKSVYVDKNKFFYYYRQVKTSATNKYDSEIFNKIVMLVSEMRRIFNEKDYNPCPQLECYITDYLIEIIRKECLMHKSVSVKKRVRLIKNHLKNENLKFCLKTASVYHSMGRDKFKIFLLKRGCVCMLCILQRISVVLMKNHYTLNKFE